MSSLAATTSPQDAARGPNSLRILHLVGAIEDSGGLLGVVRNIHGASRIHGWDNRVLVHRGYEEKRTPSLNYLYSDHLLDECPSHLRLIFQAARAWPEVKRLMAQHEFDVVHGHSRGAFGLSVWLAGLKRQPVVYTLHTRARRTGMYRWAAGLRHFHTVLIAEDMPEYYGLAPHAPRVKVIPSACAQHFFEGPFSPGQHRADSRRKFRMAGLGSLVRWKNWELVPQAIALLPPPLRERVEFHLWGQTLGDPDSVRYAAELKAQIGSLGLQAQVLLRGHTSEIEKVLMEADWLVHPTTGEPAGLAIAEAIAMGVPALVSASGGPKYTVIPRKNGLHFTPGDASSLAGKIAEVLEGQASVLPQPALRESVRSRSAATMVESLASIYESCRLR